MWLRSAGSAGSHSEEVGGQGKKAAEYGSSFLYSCEHGHCEQEEMEDGSANGWIVSKLFDERHDLGYTEVVLCVMTRSPMAQG